MKLDEAILAEVGRVGLRVPDLYERLRARRDLHPVRRLLLRVFGYGPLYPRMRRLEDRGRLERVFVWGPHSARRLTAWRRKESA